MSIIAFICKLEGKTKKAYLICLTTSKNLECCCFLFITFPKKQNFLFNFSRIKRRHPQVRIMNNGCKVRLIVQRKIYYMAESKTLEI